MKILMVEDNAFKRNAFGAILENEGHTVINAVDGMDGLEKARSENPDLIMVDLIMPKMDGYELCKALRSDPDLCGIPIVVNSAMDNEKVRILTRDCDVRFFVPLGAKRQDVLHIVNAARATYAAPLSNFVGKLEDVIAELKRLSAEPPDS